MKSVWNKIIVLMLVFTGTLAVCFFRSHKTVESAAITMGKAALPTVSMKTGENYINMLYGYTMEMEARYMRGSITPVKEGHVHATVNNCGNLILDARCELRSVDEKKVYEKKELKEFDAALETTEIQFDFQTELEADKEYLLIMNIHTDRFESINYYTRVIQVAEPHYEEQAEFVYYFSNATFDKAAAEELVSYIEPNAAEENSNLGRVTIYSSFNQLSWGNLLPERVSEPQIVYKELLGDVGCYELHYKIKALNDYETEQYYNVTEFFRVKCTSTEIYLLYYERTMKQVFEASGQSITSSRINLGIDDSLDTDYMTDEEGTYIAFEKENSLWLMDTDTNEVTSVFSFSNLVNDSDIRNTNREHKIKIVSVNKNGDVEFLVYGYMNRGEHEGKVGVSLYEYTKESNLVEETVFIPFTRSYEVLKEMIGKLLYVNESDVMYMMLNDCIYSIDLTGNEYVQIISNLKDGCYAINGDSKVIAWEKDMSYGGSDSIVVMDLEKNKEFTIHASEGMKIKVQGFVGKDIAYGEAQEGRILTDQNGITTVPMHVLRIINMEGEEQKAFTQEGYYFTSSEVKDNMINLKRVQYDESGTVLQNTTDYQIFGNEEESMGAATVSTINTDLKQKELVINFAQKVTTSDKLKQKYPKEIKFDSSNTLSLRELISLQERYYVYGRGRVTAICDNAADAVMEADKVSGVVIREGQYVWAKRSRQQQVMLSNVGIVPAADAGGCTAACVNGILQANGVAVDTMAELAAGKSTIDVLNSYLKDNQALDLAGCSLDQVLYYVNKGQPVLGMLEQGNVVLIVGYDFYNAVLLNPLTGMTYKQGLEETTAQFEQYGNRFVCIN